MNVLKISIFILFYFSINSCFSQNSYKISGFLKSIDGISISSANVIIMSAKDDSSIISYTNSDKNGYYSLKVTEVEVKNNDILIYVKAMGFQEQLKKIDFSTLKTVNTFDFRLEKSAIQIQEVVIKERIPIKAQKDTIVFDVKSFSDGSEKTVEDLLKKIPGIKVNAEGKISVKGKPIEKVLLEGEDFFSRNYRIITKNLTPLVLDKIESIDNYNENPLLNGIDASGKVVLNLKVKKEIKLKLFGNISGSIGNKNKYYVNEAIFSLTKKLNSGIISNLNNTGLDPVVELGNEWENGSDFNKSQLIGESINSFMTHKKNYLPNFDSKRITFNNSKLIAINSNFSLNKKIKAKLNSYINYDKLFLKNYNSQNIFLENNPITISDSTTDEQNPFLFNTQLKVDYLVNSKTSIGGSFNIKKLQLTNALNIQSQNLELSELIKSSSSNTSNSNIYNINIVRKIRQNQAIKIDFGSSVSSSEQLSNYTTGRYALFFKLPSSYKNGDYQWIGLENNSNINISWKIAKPKRNYSINCGFINRFEYIQTGFNVKNENSISRIDSSFDNKSSFKKKLFFAETSLQENIGLFRFVGNISLQNASMDYRDDIFDKKDFKSKFLVNSSVGVGLDIKSSKLLFIYSINQKLPVLNNLLRGYSVNDYRTFIKNESLANFTRINSFNLTYYNLNIDKYLSLNSSISYSETSPTLINIYSFSNIVSFLKLQLQDVKSNQIISSNQLDKLFPRLKLKLRVENISSRANIRNSVNDNNIESIYLLYFNNNVSITSTYKSSINFSVYHNFNYNFTFSDKKIINRLTFFNSGVILNFKPNETFLFKTSAEIFHWSQNGNKFISNFSHFEAKYTPKFSKWSFDISGNNLFGENQIIYRYMDNYSSTYNSYSLQPRFFLFSIHKLF